MYDFCQWLVHAKKFKKTRAWLRHIKNVILSKYELSIKQETLFRVSVNSGPEFYLIGTLQRGTFVRELEPIVFDHTQIMEYIDISHMSLPPRRVYGPVLLVNGDKLTLSYNLCTINY